METIAWTVIVDYWHVNPAVVQRNVSIAVADSEQAKSYLVFRKPTS